MDSVSEAKIEHMSPWQPSTSKYYFFSPTNILCFTHYLPYKFFVIIDMEILQFYEQFNSV